MLGDILNFGAKIIGGIMGQNEAENAREDQKNMAAQNIEAQKQFAQEGIRWKVADARQAGIHPLYALGANTVSYSPVSLGSVPSSPLGEAIASSGQDLSRAVDSTMTSSERSTKMAATALLLEKGGLENELLRTQIAKLRSQVGPAFPALNDANAIPGQPATRTVELPGGFQLATPGNESTQDAISKEYGDEGFPQLPGQWRFARDYIAQLNRHWTNYNNNLRARYDRTHARQYYQR